MPRKVIEKKTKKNQPKKNLLELAKAKIKPSEKTEKTLDVKAKEKVERLLEFVDIEDTEMQQDNVQETVQVEVGDMSDIGWLQEQLQKLSEENEALRAETEEAKNNYKKLFESRGDQVDEISAESPMIPDSIIKTNVINLFVDVQDNFQGRNPERTQYTNIVPIPFMMKMVKLFPFLQEQKRF